MIKLFDSFFSMDEPGTVFFLLFALLTSIKFTNAIALSSFDEKVDILTTDDTSY
jgi:hypothetical protein